MSALTLHFLSSVKSDYCSTCSTDYIKIWINNEGTSAWLLNQQCKPHCSLYKNLFWNLLGNILLLFLMYVFENARISIDKCWLDWHSICYRLIYAIFLSFAASHFFTSLFLSSEQIWLTAVTSQPKPWPFPSVSLPLWYLVFSSCLPPQNDTLKLIFFNHLSKWVWCPTCSLSSPKFLL